MKSIIITGASRGIGEATARAAARAGANVVLNGRDIGRLTVLATEVDRLGGTALVVPGDVSDAAVASKIATEATEAFGGIEALVNNAGVIEPIGRFADCDPIEWERNVAVNLLGAAWVTRAALPELRAVAGRIVNLSSGAGVSPIPGWSAYCAAKAGLNHLTSVIAAEEPSVTVVAFSPGMTATDMQAAVRQHGASGMPPEVHSRFTNAHAEGRLRDPDVIGRAVLTLAQSAPAHWSGRVVAVDDPEVVALTGSR